MFHILNWDPDLRLAAAQPVELAAFALSYRNPYTNPMQPINIIVYQEATCTGLQHIYARKGG